MQRWFIRLNCCLCGFAVKRSKVNFQSRHWVICRYTVVGTVGFGMAQIGHFFRNTVVGQGKKMAGPGSRVLRFASDGTVGAADSRLALASNTSLHCPQRTHPSDTRNWSGTTLNIVVHAGHLVIRLISVEL